MGRAIWGCFFQCVNRFFDVESFNMENAGLGFHFEKVGKCISMFGISCWNLVFLGLPLRLAKICSMRNKCLITLEELSLCRMQGSLGISQGCSGNRARDLSSLKRESCHWTKQPATTFPEVS